MILQEEISKLELRLATRHSLHEARKLNTASDHIPDEELSNLDSSLKKNTAANKKLRTINAASLEAVCKDMESINQSMFLPEAASALIQATTKMSTVQWVLKVCLPSMCGCCCCS